MSSSPAQATISEVATCPAPRGRMATLTRLVEAAAGHGPDVGAPATAERAVADGYGEQVPAVAAKGATAGVPAPPTRG